MLFSNLLKSRREPSRTKKNTHTQTNEFLNRVILMDSMVKLLYLFSGLHRIVDHENIPSTKRYWICKKKTFIFFLIFKSIQSLYNLNEIVHYQLAKMCEVGHSIFHVHSHYFQNKFIIFDEIVCLWTTISYLINSRFGFSPLILNISFQM